MTRRLRKSMVLIACSVAGLALIQCAGPVKKSPPFHPVIDGPGIPGEIARLEKLMGTLKDKDELAETSLRLSLLYSSYRNPSPDYRKALKHMDSFLSFTKGRKPSEQIRYLHGLLRSLQHLSDEGRALDRKVSQLEKENREMKEIVERLKHLDIKMEERRRQIQ